MLQVLCRLLCQQADASAGVRSDLDRRYLLCRGRPDGDGDLLGRQACTEWALIEV